MKTKVWPIIIVAALTAVTARAQAPQASVPPINVRIQSDVKDLAAGYAAAFSSVTHTPVTLGFEREGVVRVLEDVRSVKASEGALIVEVGKGLTYVISARDVVYITDGPTPKPKVSSSPGPERNG